MNHYVVFTCFNEMEEDLKILEEFKTISMAGFRNILVYGYTRIDRAIVYDNLKKLNEFRDFQKYILKYLDKQAPPQQPTPSNPS